MTNGNDLAFPSAHMKPDQWSKENGFTGDNIPLTKRELFAAIAMQGILSSIGDIEYKGSKQVPPEEIARMSTTTADALIEQLNEKQP